MAGPGGRAPKAQGPPSHGRPMDTRRRPPQPRDARTAPAPQPDLGSETKVVKLTDLQPVGRIGGSTRPAIAVAIIAVAIVAFAAGNAIQPPKPTASPTAAPAAIVSQPASPTAMLTPPGPTPTRKLVVPTPLPSNAHPWTWNRMDFQVDLGAQPPENMWAIGDHIVMLGWTDEDSDRPLFHMGSINSGFGWDYHNVPAAIADLSGASVIDDHIWFLALITGVTPADSSWQLVGTSTGESWESLGPTDGLPLPAEATSGAGSGAGFIGRVGDIWVVDVFQAEGPGLLYWSEDGRQWERANVPAVAGEVHFFNGTMFRDRMVALGESFDGVDQVAYFVLTSTDGKTWERAAVNLDAGRSLGNLACNAGTCVVAEYPFESEGVTRHVWVTEDGETWSRVAVDLPLAAPISIIQLIRATDDGFIALGGTSDAVLLSDDGRRWRVVEGVMPAIAQEILVNLVVARDLIVGYGEASSSDLPNYLWRGSLKLLEAAP